MYWFDHVEDGLDDDIGMCVVKPSITATRQPKITVIHTDTIFHTVHLIPVYAKAVPIHPQEIPNQLHDYFHFFYINKYADHHSFTMTF